MVKISSDGDRLQRMIQFDMVRMALLVETKRRSDVEADGRGWKELRVESIQEIRKGPMSEVFKKHAKSLRPGEHESCFTVFYVRNAQNENVNLIAPSPAIVDAYLDGLQALRLTPRDGSVTDLIEVFVQRVWKVADKDADGFLSAGEIVDIMNRFNVADVGRRKVRALIAKAKPENRSPDGEKINFQGFVALFKYLRRRDDVKAVFDLICSKGPGDESVVTFDAWKTFMREVQKSKLDDDGLKKLFAKFVPEPEKGMNLENFKVFLSFSEECLVYAHRRSDVWQDMTQPLSNYFISTSHNTYLTANQLTGGASIETFVRYLVLGSRVVELDTWEKNGEPVITHGHTLTDAVSYYDVIRAIKAYGFRGSPYPIVLDHELHVSPAVLTKMAKFLREQLGDAIYAPAEAPAVLPSPAGLKNKYIIKDGGAVRRADQKSENGLHPAGTQFQGPPTTFARDGGPMPREFAELVFLHDWRFATLDKSRPVPTNVIFERDESVCTGLIKTDWSGWATYAASHLCRVYPEGLRVGSSNMDPTPFWAMGFQMCAFNMQTFDRALELSDALFGSNGFSGYVLKPEYLRPAPGDVAKRPPPTPWTVRVRIVSASALQKPYGEKVGEVVDPYVEVNMLGLNAKIISSSGSEFRGVKSDLPENLSDEARKEEEKKAETAEAARLHIYSTKTVRDNGWDPIWNEEVVFQVERPEMAFLRFVVRDDETFVKDKVIGSAMLYLSNIREGYRAVPLFNWRGFATFASVFVRIDIAK
ncbi:PLC-like phosphodiesterase [Hyaloraphidium curvatum]|nr:PLC-like phosphodiesterase [Hyaloraphidium curvatum]